MTEAEPKPPRALPEAATRVLRSFVQRAGRLTPAQQRALDALWPKYGLEIAQGPLHAPARFGRTAPLVLEIGFGNGEALIHGALHSPERDFIGIEVHKPGVGRVLNAIESNALSNVLLYAEDAVEVLKQCIGEGALDEVRIYFPDPWHKKRHVKRRLIQPGFVELLSSRIAPGGLLHLATDWQPYAEQMWEVMDAASTFRNTEGPGGHVPRPDWRPETHFERRGLRLGHGVWDLLYRRV
ncbi:MAG: tRNA (guanosine(46)-N7)-methyltransferase TrmB [Xanthomonadales bacterium]|nr:tRNA (guanosine(46)-N7)-methyltransferase TrmB [Xanthomonadales bacterium]